MIEVHAGRTPELIRLARVAWAVSGSVGLELMVEALPSVVIYKIKRFDLWVASCFIKSKYISLVNLLADAELFPEYLTWRDLSDELVRWALQWLDDPSAHSEARESLVTCATTWRARVHPNGRRNASLRGWRTRPEQAPPLQPAARDRRTSLARHGHASRTDRVPPRRPRPDDTHLARTVQANVNICTPCPSRRESLRSRSPNKKRGTPKGP